MPDSSAHIDHIAIAVNDLAQGLKVFSALGTPGHREIIAEHCVEALIIHIGESRLELLKPLAEDSPVARFIAKRGEGLHHIAICVADIKRAIRKCAEAGLRPLHYEPKIGAEGKLVCFLDPKTTMGVLIELTQEV